MNTLTYAKGNRQAPTQEWLDAIAHFRLEAGDAIEVQENPAAGITRLIVEWRNIDGDISIRIERPFDGGQHKRVTQYDVAWDYVLANLYDA